MLSGKEVQAVKRLEGMRLSLAGLLQVTGGKCKGSSVFKPVSFQTVIGRQHSVFSGENGISEARIEFPGFKGPTCAGHRPLVTVSDCHVQKLS